MYATGSPAVRRATARSNEAAASGPTGLSWCAITAVRPTPTASPSSSSASSRGELDPDAARRPTASRSSSPTVATRANPSPTVRAGS